VVRVTPGIRETLVPAANFGIVVDMTAALERRFVARRHVDYGRVRSAICPAR
jgi:hypothetical protein